MAIATQIKVTGNTLRQKAASLRSVITQFQVQLDNLTRSEQSLNYMWDGQANDVFHQYFTKNMQQFRNFKTNMEEYARALDTAAEEYDRVEARNASIATTR